ncbi:hypothetical protein [Xanthomonas phage OP1]|uniref:Uncharacterized protein n=1 Tax=Xanthomonas phage OP1 TaxID=2994040 RepID=Q2NPG7_9CAUD|nr:hypothetical protein OP1_ORF24 [Xanthomonas phage OP1]BAE72729.1 hypothetical protein [Xanthomonas phage OP1]
MLATTATLILMTLTSNPGENMDQFITRVAPQAQAYTAEHEVEVCGAIGQDGDTLTLVLTTDNDAWECKVSKVRGKFTGYIFHTHTKKGNEGWANADLAIPGYLATPKKLLWQNQNKMKKLADY